MRWVDIFRLPGAKRDDTGGAFMFAFAAYVVRGVSFGRRC